MRTAQFELPVRFHRWQVLSLFWSFTWLFLNSWKVKSPSMEVFHLPREGTDFLVAGLVDSCAHHYKSNIGRAHLKFKLLKLLSHLVLSSMDSFSNWSYTHCFKHDQYDSRHELDWGETFLNDKTKWVEQFGYYGWVLLMES